MKDPILKKNYKNYEEKNIALIGHMGSGKSIIGKLIAKKLNILHIDSDQIIEKNSNKTIKEIFIKMGEEKFRLIEEKTILALNTEKKIVLSLGGGSILSHNIRKLLKKAYITVFLDVNINILKQRLQNSKKRPLLINVDIEKKIKKLDIQRRKFYLLADITLKDFENTNATLSNFIKEYEKLNEKNI